LVTIKPENIKNRTIAYGPFQKKGETPTIDRTMPLGGGVLEKLWGGGRGGMFPSDEKKTPLQKRGRNWWDYQKGSNLRVGCPKDAKEGWKKFISSSNQVGRRTKKKKTMNGIGDGEKHRKAFGGVP